MSHKSVFSALNVGKHFTRILVYCVIVIVMVILFFGGKTSVNYDKHVTPAPHSHKLQALSQRTDISRWPNLATLKQMSVEKEGTIKDVPQLHNTATPNKVSMERGIHKDLQQFYSMTTLKKMSMEKGPNKDVPQGQRMNRPSKIAMEKDGPCHNDSKEITQSKMKHLFKTLRVRSPSALPIKVKQCTKCGAIVKITLPLTLLTSTSLCGGHEGTITVISQAAAQCPKTLFGKVIGISLEQELGLSHLTPSVVFQVNGSYQFDNYLQEIMKGCSSNHKQGTMFVILQVGNVLLHTGNDTSPTLFESTSISETVTYLIYFYIIQLWNTFDNTFKAETENKIKSLNLFRHLGYKNSSMTLKQVLFQENVLCNMHPKLLGALQNMDSMTSHESSLGRKIKLQIKRIIGREYGVNFLQKRSLYEEIDGQVAELLQRHRVSAHK